MREATPPGDPAAPRVTVILVTHEDRQAAQELLEALFGFGGEPFRLVLVENASRDGTPELLRGYARRPGVELIENRENRRLAAALNQALARVSTEYLVYLCARHALVTGPLWLERLLRFMDERPELSIAGDVWEPGYTLESRLYAPGWSPAAHQGSLLHVQGGAFVARRRLFEEVGGFNEEEHPHGGMDVEFSYRLLSLGLPLGRCPAIHCPPAPLEPATDSGPSIVHPATEAQRAAVRGLLASPRVPAEALASRGVARSEARPAAIVFCERLPNQSFCESIVRELGHTVEVRPCGPGWPVERLEEVDARGVSFFLELDAVSGSFVRPAGLASLRVPKFAWLVDTHKKTEFQRQIGRDVDLTFVANRTWAHVFEGPTAWLPLHADQELFRPLPVPPAHRRWDVSFVGSQPWRAEALERIGKRHGLNVLVKTTTGPREKSETAAIYAHSRLVFNRHVTNDLNFRVFEALAAGRVLLTDAQSNGQYELFQDGRHLLYYKDDQDLERLVLELLADEPRRLEIEREALLLAHARHTTRARVRSLITAIEQVLGGPLGRREVPIRHAPAAPAPEPAVQLSDRVTGAPGSGAPAALAPRAPAAAAGRPFRCLILAGPEPQAVLQLSYAERLGRALAGRGHSVTVLRQRRGRCAPLGSDVVTLELDRAPLPDASTPENRLLASAGPFQRAADATVRERGAFDLLLVEGPEGALVGPPLARRFGMPLALALEDCVVARQGNRLSREQLYLAELEHWGLDRAELGIAPTPEVVAALQRHYSPTAQLLASGWPTEGVSAPEGAERLLARLGIAGEYHLVLAPADRQRVTLTLLDGRPVLGAQRLKGPALGALAHRAKACLLRGPMDLGAADLRALAPRWGLTSGGDRADLEAALTRAERWPGAGAVNDSALEALESLARARGKSAPRRAPGATPALAGAST